MYCGTDLPAPGLQAAAPIEEIDIDAEAEKASRLLQELSPEARAMMPGEVLRTLEARAAVGLARKAPVTAEIAVPDFDLPAPPVPQSIFDVPEPSPMGDPSIPDMAAVAVEPLDLASDLALEPFETLPEGDPEDDSLASFSSLGSATASFDAEAGDDETSPGGLGMALLRALGSGGGPFGRRELPVRLILVPDSGYRGEVHWLKHRLASTLEMDLYTAGQALQRDIPSFLVGAESLEEGRGLAQRLSDAGLKILTLDRSSWLLNCPPEIVLSVRLDGELAIFRTVGRAELACPRSDFLWACLGEVRVETAPVPMVPERNRWGTAERVSGRSVEASGGPFLLMDLIRGERRPLRFRSDEFDFSCLGEDRGLAAGLNLRKLLGWLAPSGMDPVPLDERFKRVPHIPGVPPAQDGRAERHLSRREVEFTEYVLLLDCWHHDAG